MSLHLVTGYAGKAHVTSADQGAFNAGVVGTSEYVMGTGFQLSAQVISNNQIRIFDGDIMMQGRHINIKKDTYEDVAIANGLQGLNRNDLIVLRYTKDANTGVESIALAVLQGVSTEGTASDPAHTIGDILGGECLLHEMPLYRVKLTGLNVGELVPLFTVVDSVAEANSKIQAINNDLTTSNGTAFRFEYNAVTGEYGYMAKVAGADTFFPFSNAKKLYEALQYSCLVTDDMTFDEICNALATEYPVIPEGAIYYNGINKGEFAYHAGGLGVQATQHNEELVASFGDSLALINGGTASIPINIGSYISKKYDVSNYSKLCFHHDSLLGTSDDYSFIDVFLTKVKQETMEADASVRILQTKSTKASGSVELNVADLSGEYYVGIYLQSNRAGQSSQITFISDMYFE